MRDRRQPLNTNPDFVDGVRAVLQRHGYEPERLLDHMGKQASLEVNPRTLPGLLYATRGGAPLDTLIRLFVLGTQVPDAAAAQAVAPMSLEAWIDGGLLARTASGIRSPFRLTLQYDVMAVIDPNSQDLAEDHVVGMGPATAELIAASTPARVERALDLGTGCGGTAVRLAEHAQEVVATDLNERAVCLATFNARLNGAQNVDVRCGDLLAPVAGETFDLVAMNPPFVISPGGRLMFRDGGDPGDAFMRRVVREIPAVLRDGALAVLTAQWATLAGQERDDRLKSWVEGTGCDCLLLVRKEFQPLEYALGWSAELDADPHQGAEELARWMDYYREAGIVGMTLGWVVLRKRAGDNWFETRDATEGVDAAALEVLRRLIDAVDVLKASSTLSDLRPTLAPGATIHQELSPGPEGWTPDVTLLRVRSGVHATLNVDGNMAHVLGRCDGTRSVAELAGELAQGLGAAPDAVLRGLDLPLRSLIARGVLRLSPG